jgi:hypothetical protein
MESNGAVYVNKKKQFYPRFFTFQFSKQELLFLGMF